VILLSHPTANQNVRQAALALAATGLLDEFWTCILWRQGSLLDQLIALVPPVKKELRRRSFPTELAPFIHSYPWRELGRLLTSKLGLANLSKEERSPLSIDSVYRSFDQRVALHLHHCLTIKGVYAYEDGALATFRAAKQVGVKCFYEHPTVHWREVQRLEGEEAELSPEWISTLGALNNSQEKLRRKDEELALADVIVTPSSFASRSLTHLTTMTTPVHVITYGTSPEQSREALGERGSRLRVIFVGALTQAKGLGYLLDAADRLRGEILLTIVGRRVSPKVPEAARLHSHRWIPSLPHPDLIREMVHHDVLVLPSLHEGFGLVIGEAMAQGVVVITTAHTAGPDLISDGLDGFVVPIRSAEAIAEKLSLLQRDRELLRAMQTAAQAKARSMKWENYRHRLAALARKVIANH
jgi:glycosyltransferase involved in cell wall biosynthesis